MFNNLRSKRKSSFNVMICLSLFTINNAYATVSPNELLANKLSQCIDISDDKNRLLCFDQVANEVKDVAISTVTLEEKSITSNSTSVSKTVVEKSIIEAEVVKTQAQIEQEKIDAFAKNQVVLTKEEQQIASAQEMTEFSGTITALKKLIRGEWVITLENGQKWQQKSTDRFKLKVGNVVVIKKGSLGAIYLNKEGSSRNIRVKRIK